MMAMRRHGRVEAVVLQQPIHAELRHTTHLSNLHHPVRFMAERCEQYGFQLLLRHGFYPAVPALFAMTISQQTPWVRAVRGVASWRSAVSSMRCQLLLHHGFAGTAGWTPLCSCSWQPALPIAFRHDAVPRIATIHGDCCEIVMANNPHYSQCSDMKRTDMKRTDLDRLLQYAPGPVIPDDWVASARYKFERVLQRGIGFSAP